MQLIIQSHLFDREMFLNEHVISHPDKSFWDKVCLENVCAGQGIYASGV